MTLFLTRPRLITALLAALCAVACAPAPPDAQEGSEGNEADAPHHTRDLIFIGARDDEPVSVLFSFTGIEETASTRRRTQGWLGHGAGWERFLDSEQHTRDTGAVWRIVPSSGLRILVGGPAEIEEITFQRGERVLRLEIEGVRSDWTTFRNSRYRILDGRVRLGPGWVDGTLLEMQRFRGRPSEGQVGSWVFLSDGEGTQIVVADLRSGEDRAEQLAWTLFDDEERTWDRVDLRPVDARAFDPARREIPGGWQLAVPEARIAGPIEVVAMDPVAGEERRGRRAVDTRYTVRARLTLAGSPVEMFGMARYIAD